MGCPAQAKPPGRCGSTLSRDHPLPFANVSIQTRFMPTYTHPLLHAWSRLLPNLTDPPLQNLPPHRTGLRHAHCARHLPACLLRLGWTLDLLPATRRAAGWRFSACEHFAPPWRNSLPHCWFYRIYHSTIPFLTFVTPTAFLPPCYLTLSIMFDIHTFPTIWAAPAHCAARVLHCLGAASCCHFIR